MEPTETDRAYLAGLIDGEGSLQINTDAYGWRVKVSIANSGMPIHHWLQARWGGSFTQQGRKQCWSTYWTGKERVTHILDAAYPYLVLKKGQADILRVFIRTIGERGHDNPGMHEGRLTLMEQLDLEREICLGKENA